MPLSPSPSSSPARPRRSLDQRSYVETLVRDGRSTREVSDTTGVPIATINYWRLKYQWPASPIQPIPFEAEVRAHALALLDDGISQSEVGRRLNISRPTLLRWLRLRGTSLRQESGNTPTTWRCTCGSLVKGTTCLGCGSLAAWARPVEIPPES